MNSAAPVSIGMVTTTINQPVLLEEYCRNARAFGHEQVRFFVVGDMQTPAAVEPWCRQLSARYGYAVEYYGVERQRAVLKDTPALAQHLPFRSISRRNVGMLEAYRCGAECVITIDDDNWVTDTDYFGFQSKVGRIMPAAEVSSETGWWNTCTMLKEASGQQFYHRGFPPGQRRAGRADLGRWSEASRRVVVNAGLWLGDPDVDAVTRLAKPVDAIALEPAAQSGVFLASGTWCPFNSQNTALHRSVIPAYFLSPYVGRYDDIWASFVLRRLIDHFKDAVCYGPPLVRQERNAHNLWKDLSLEMHGMEATDSLVDFLRRAPLQAGSYQEGCLALAGKIRGWAEAAALKEEGRRMLLRFAEGMQIWASCNVWLGEASKQEAAATRAE